MPITAEELTGTPTDPNSHAATLTSVSNSGGDPEVTIEEWVTEVPRHRRTSPFDKVIEQIRQTGDTQRSARISWGHKTISPNKVNQMRKRYPDCEFSQVSKPDGRETYVRYTGQSPNA